MLAVFLATLIVGNQFIPPEKSVERHMLGHDFTAFYSAGHFAAIGQFDKLYDIQAIKDFEQETGRRSGLSLGDSYGPYWNPPFYAWIFVPLSKLSYSRALLFWTLINAACGIAALVLLIRLLPERTPWQTRALVPFLVVTSMPVLQALSHGQNTMTSLLLLTGTVTFWRKNSPTRAGLIAGLLFYKPQLAAIVALALIATLGWRALVGLAITGSILLLLTIRTMPGTLTAFFTLLPANLRFMQIDHPYVWERHATVKAFWRLLFQGRGAGEALPIVTILTGICVLALAVCLLIAIRRQLQISNLKSQIPRDSLIAATIATMPLLMPFYFDYDLMLLAIPAVLYAGQIVRSASADGIVLEREFSVLPELPSAKADPTKSDRWLNCAWIALYLWTLINPGIAGVTRVNLTVPLLSLVASLLILRALRERPTTAPTYRPSLTIPPCRPATGPCAETFSAPTQPAPLACSVG
jgi:hypothetical protein